MNQRVIGFAAIAFALSWLAWLPLTAYALGWIEARPTPYWHLVGGCGPAVAAILMSWRDGEARRALARCVTGPARWIAVAVLGPVLLYALAAGVLRALGVTVDLAETARTTEYPTLGIAAYAMVNIVFYGFGEELGWRGYLLPHLQNRISPTRASLAVAAIWALWHVPLFAFASGMAAMGIGGFVGWLASIVAGSFLMTALYNSSRGSVLTVALFHGVLDILMSSPTGGALQSTMGALVSIAGFTIAFRARGQREPSFE